MTYHYQPLESIATSKKYATYTVVLVHCNFLETQIIVPSSFQNETICIVQKI